MLLWIRIMQNLYHTRIVTSDNHIQAARLNTGLSPNPYPVVLAQGAIRKQVSQDLVHAVKCG